MTGDRCYLIESGDKISLVEILSIKGGFYTVKFIGTEHISGLRVRKSRLYKTPAEAQKIVEKNRMLTNRKLLEERQLELESVKELYKKSYWPCQVDLQKGRKK